MKKHLTIYSNALLPDARHPTQQHQNLCGQPGPSEMAVAGSNYRRTSQLGSLAGPRVDTRSHIQQLPMDNITRPTQGSNVEIFLKIINACTL